MMPCRLAWSIAGTVAGYASIRRRAYEKEKVMVGNNGGLFVWPESESSTTTINSAFSSDGTTWSTPTPVTFPSMSRLSQPPSLGVFQNQYYLAMVDTNQALWLSSSPDGVAWSTPTNPFGSWQPVAAPGLAAFNPLQGAIPRSVLRARSVSFSF
jgi:hypothetical protein